MKNKKSYDNNLLRQIHYGAITMNNRFKGAFYDDTVFAI